ncbi:MAG TPA: MBL fold metallo-hydrolase [Patescibacteria group bacterium]|nr:MBL fold metallo-hydrolase [Patescibacteria group bacterium]
MQIQWLGQSCFKIQVKSSLGETTIVTDPFSEGYGLKLPRLTADIVTVSHDHKDHSDLSKIKGATENQTPFIVKGPGEYEIKNVFVRGLPASHDDESGKKLGSNIIYLIRAEGITIVHLGDLGQKELTPQQLEYIEETDILLIPVGGKYTINGAEAATLVSQIEPRIVIPMHYKIPGLNVDIETADKFVKEMGNHKEEMDKLKISKKDLPQEDTKLILLKV